MIKEKINSQKGITLTALVITIIIVLILTNVTINGINTSNKAMPYNNMIADITLLEDKILVYYNKYGEIPKLNENQLIAGYYEIDLSKLENLTLNYGTKQDGADDVYLVNDNLEVYYYKGIDNSHTK